MFNLNAHVLTYPILPMLPKGAFLCIVAMVSSQCCCFQGLWKVAKLGQQPSTMVLLRHGEREDYMAEKARPDSLDVVVRITAVKQACLKIDQTQQKEQTIVISINCIFMVGHCHCSYLENSLSLSLSLYIYSYIHICSVP